MAAIVPQPRLRELNDHNGDARHSGTHDGSTPGAPGPTPPDHGGTMSSTATSGTPASPAPPKNRTHYLYLAVIGAVAAAADPERAALYRTNEQRVVQELAALDEELDAALAPVRGKPFVVFHDAYQYLEAAYGLDAAGSITVSPDRPPSARRLVELAEKIDRSGAVCVFGEVQTASPLVGTLIAGRGIGTGRLDPEGGATVTPGPNAYAELMRRNVGVLVGCLSRSS
jgi:zinc transport system substrate-binding protein